MDTEGKGIVAELEPVVNQALEKRPTILSITTLEQAEAVVSFITMVKGVRKIISDKFKPKIDAAHRLHKDLIKLKDEFDARPAAAEAAARAIWDNYQAEQRRKAAEEQKRLDDEARKKAAQEAAAEGDRKLAKAIEKGKVPVVSSVTVAAPKIEGASGYDRYYAEVVDKMALIKAVAAGKASPEFLIENMPALNKVMDSTKGSMIIPGVKAVKKFISSFRG